MKKFSFSLDSVLDYKNQILEALQGEHAQILAELRRQEQRIEELKAQYAQCNQDYNDKKSYGMTIMEASVYLEYIRKLEDQQVTEREKLAIIIKREQAKRTEVVEAKIDTSSIEKLREKRVEEYNKAVAKSEEIFMEEFVSNVRASSAANAG